MKFSKGNYIFTNKQDFVNRQINDSHGKRISMWYFALFYLSKFYFCITNSQF